MKNPKKKIMIGSLAIVLALIIGVLLAFFIQNNNIDNQQSTEDVTKETYLKDDDDIELPEGKELYEDAVVYLYQPASDITITRKSPYFADSIDILHMNGPYVENTTKELFVVDVSEADYNYTLKFNGRLTEDDVLVLQPELWQWETTSYGITIGKRSAEMKCVEAESISLSMNNFAITLDDVDRKWSYKYSEDNMYIRLDGYVDDAGVISVSYLGDKIRINTTANLGVFHVYTYGIAGNKEVDSPLWIKSGDQLTEFDITINKDGTAKLEIDTSALYQSLN